MPTGVVTSPDLEIWAVNPLTMPRSATAALSEDLRLGGSSKPPGLSERNSAYLRALVGCSSWLQFWRKQYAVLEALGCRRSPCVQYHNRCREWCIGYMIRQRATSLDLDLNPNFSQARSIENVLTNTCLFTFPRRTRRRLEDLKFSHYGSQAPRHQETSVAGPELAGGWHLISCLLVVVGGEGLAMEGASMELQSVSHNLSRTSTNTIRYSIDQLDKVDAPPSQKPTIIFSQSKCIVLLCEIFAPFPIRFTPT